MKVDRLPLRARLPGRGNLTLTMGTVLISGWILVGVFAPLIAPYDPIAQDVSNALHPPGFAHPFGTDNFGRDVLSRVIWGTRIDLAMGIGGVIAPLVIGCTIGLLAGYFGGIVDTLLMRLLDITISFPFFVLMIAIISILGPGLVSFFIALAIVGWVSYARLVRARTLSLRHSDFVAAGQILGFGSGRIMFRHIMPNAALPVLVFAMSDIVLTILLGSSLSYLGLGVQPPQAEWGVMIAEGQNFISTSWWITLFPGLAIVLLALGFSLLADGLALHYGVRE